MDRASLDPTVQHQITFSKELEEKNQNPKGLKESQPSAVSPKGFEGETSEAQFPLAGIQGAEPLGLPTEARAEGAKSSPEAKR
jgi:hypothetical protein